MEAMFLVLNTEIKKRVGDILSQSSLDLGGAFSVSLEASKSN